VRGRTGLTAVAIAALVAGGAWAGAGAYAGPVSAKPRHDLLRRGGLASARRWVRDRAGTISFAVARPGKRVRGRFVDRAAASASVSKAMLLVALLRAAPQRALRGDERALLRAMITMSDNDSADAVYTRVGGAGLVRVARAAGMRGFAEAGYWSEARVTAADLARLFLRIDRLVPCRHRGFARRVLASVVSWQRWGVPGPAERRGLRVFFKGGWRTGLTHQAALVEGRGTRAALAVLTLDSPSQAYAEATIEGVAARMLAR
jgi:beta-lactamase family protein